MLHKLPAIANAEQIKWQPALDYDKDSCYNVAAIDDSGNINKGNLELIPALSAHLWTLGPNQCACA